MLGVAANYLIVDPGRVGDPLELSQLRLLLFVIFGGLITYWLGRLDLQRDALAAELRSRQRAEMALSEREERTRMAIESADIGTWDLNVLTGDRQWSDRAKAMFGLSLDADVTKVAFLDLLHEDDRLRAGRAIQAALDPAGDGHYEVDYRTVWPDGTVRWVVAKGQAFFQGDGVNRRAVRFIGTVLDFTDRKTMEEESRRNHEVLKLAQKIARIGHWEWNSLTDENQWSSEIEALYGLPPGGFEGGYEGWTKLVHPDDLPTAEQDVKRALETGEYFTEFRVIWPDGSVHWLETRAKVFKDGPDGPLRLFGVNMDVTDRKRLEEELRSRNRALDRADRQKDEFLATLAHELRNPLSPISYGIELWPFVEGDRARTEQLRSMMDRQVGQMVRLIDDLMDVSRIASGKIELRNERMDLRDAICGAVESIQSTVDTNAQQLNVTLPREPIYVDGDVTRLTQVFGNILHNAAKFTPREGTITLVAEARADRAIVTIRDNGLGIPENMLAEIFDTFRQVDSTLERSHGGLGIGLMLVKRITEIHGGTVEADSDGVGTGSQFVVNLPRLMAEETLPVDGKNLDHRQAESMRRHRVLVVDDMPEVAESLQALLEVIGQDVFVAHDARSALDLMLAKRPDIAFLDIAMPDMNGYDVAREVRARPELQYLTLVALTGYGQAEDQRRAAAAGFNHHLTKPASLAGLRELLLAVPVAT